MHCLEGASNGNRSSQGRTGPHPRTHPAAQIPLLEILHHQPRVIVADSQVIKFHHARMLDALDDLVFLQKTPERMVEIVLVLVSVPNHLQGNQRPRGPALSQEQTGDRPASDPPNTPVPANKRTAELLRIATRRARLPPLARSRLSPLR